MYYKIQRNENFKEIFSFARVDTNVFDNAAGAAILLNLLNSKSVWMTPKSGVLH